MKLSRQKKVTAVLLILYWPAFFLAAHTPVPQVVREAGVSDKGLHLLAYLTLAFLLWFTVGGEGRTNWRRAAPWCVFLAMIGYAILDEWLQNFVSGRSCDAWDLLADLAGTCLGLAVFSFLPFWPAGLLVVAIIIFGGANIARENLADVLPAANAIFHVTAYAAFTAMWVRYACLAVPVTGQAQNEARWLLTAFAAPLALLLSTMIFSAIVGRQLVVLDIIISVASTIAVIAMFYLLAASGRKTQEPRREDGVA